MTFRKVKVIAVKIHWFISSQLGINLILLFKSIPGFYRFVKDLINFKKKYDGSLRLKPCVHDWNEEGGVTKSEYFWQDLLVARMIFSKKPERHVDIGSRIDGFISNVASFRDIEVIDVRPITSSIPGVKFIQLDMMNFDGERESYDSVSCLHALEHFGLGRYGDPIDVLGYEKGISNLSRILKNKGVLYLSVPVGVELVEFNANRVFDPNTIVNYSMIEGLSLTNLITISNIGNVVEYPVGEHIKNTLNKLSKQEYNLGIFVFTKKT